MPRSGVTTAFQTALVASVIRPCFFVSIKFATSTLNVWTGLYPIVWGGFTWQGVGTLMNIVGMSEDSSVDAKNITVSLSGIPSDALTGCLTEIQRGNPVQIYFGLFQADGVTLVANPVLAYEGRVDQPTIHDGMKDCTISLNVENPLVDLNRSIWRRYTSADQQLDYPNDLGCDFVANIAELDIYWGRLPHSINN